MMNKRNIAIIEDHAVMRRGLEAWFQETGRWNVTKTTASLEEARAVLPGLPVDLVLLDLQLEDGWGLDIISSFTSQNNLPPKSSFTSQNSFAKQSFQQMPMFAVYTGFDSHTHVRAALSLGVRAYITKRRTEAELEEFLAAKIKPFPFLSSKNLQKMQKMPDYLENRA